MRSFVCPFVRSVLVLRSCGRWVFGRLDICLRGRLFVWLSRLLVVCSSARVFVWSIVLLVFWSFVRVFVLSCYCLVILQLLAWSFIPLFIYSICLFLVFLEGRFPEAAYFYGISQDSKFTLSLLQLTEKEGTNARNENRKASMQRLAENIANLDPEVILLYTTEEKIQLLMAQTVC